MSSHQFNSQQAEVELPVWFRVAFACCFGVALGALMGYQMHEQTTPAAEVAQQTASNTVRIANLEKRIEEQKMVNQITLDLFKLMSERYK